MLKKALNSLNGWLFLISAASVLCLAVGFGMSAYAAPVGDSSPKAQYGAVNVLNSAATAVPATASKADRNSVMVQNRGPNSIYCGWDSSVTTSTGVEVQTGATLIIDIVVLTPKLAQPQLYCIAATADQTSPANTRYMEVK